MNGILAILALIILAKMLIKITHMVIDLEKTKMMGKKKDGKVEDFENVFGKLSKKD